MRNLRVQVVTDSGLVVWEHGYDHTGQRGGLSPGTSSVELLQEIHDVTSLANSQASFELAFALSCANDPTRVPDRARAAGQVDDQIPKP